MRYSQLGRQTFVMRLEMGDDILKELRRFAGTKRILAGTLQGIGSLSRVKLGHYDFKAKRYSYENFLDDLEIITLDGNISTMDGKAVPHVHVTLGRRNFTVIGGHLDEGSSANMVEIVLQKLPGKMTKAKDEQVGLNLLQLTERLQSEK